MGLKTLNEPLDQPPTSPTLNCLLDNRLTQLIAWLSNDLELAISSINPASSDASFRRYFRTITNQGTFVVMDAPPDVESLSEFLAVGKSLEKQDVHVPKIYYEDARQGYLLMEDLGNRLYLDELQGNAPALYSKALDALIKIQNVAPGNSKFSAPPYTAEMLEQEMDLFRDWFVGKHLSLTFDAAQRQAWDNIKTWLTAGCLAQPQLWTHRDYHSRNLMITDRNSPGVIDFQGMVVGPIGYDLASLFKDCYVEWSRSQQQVWLEQYHSKALQHLNVTPFSVKQLTRWVDIAGLQRHLKVLGIFCRLYYRDGKEQYLADLPLAAKYVVEAVKLYPELDDFNSVLSPLLEKSL